MSVNNSKFNSVFFKAACRVNPVTIVTTVSLPSLSIFLTFFSIGTEKVSYFSVFYPRSSNCSSNSFTNSFMIKL